MLLQTHISSIRYLNELKDISLNFIRSKFDEF